MGAKGSKNRPRRRRICAREGCNGVITKDERPDQDYCSTECGRIVRKRRETARNRKNRKAAKRAARRTKKLREAHADEIEQIREDHDDQVEQIREQHRQELDQARRALDNAAHAAEVGRERISYLQSNRPDPDDPDQYLNDVEEFLDTLETRYNDTINNLRDAQENLPHPDDEQS